ncbi:MAG TPA: sialidase family protein, partial [Pseudolabrys sp.]|nr:sialidase family protein [Pseudolabrys sp.]
TADPANANRAYAIWDRLELFAASAEQSDALAAAVRFEHDKVIMAGHALQQMRSAAADAAVEPPEFKGPTYFTRTINGGKTWELPHIIYDPGADNQTINNIVLVQPNGNLVAIFTEILNLPNGAVRVNIALKRSVDFGFSFLPTKGVIRAQRIHSLAVANPVGTFTPDLREPVRDAGILFDPAVDPQNGNLYLVWQDNRFGNGAVDQIAFSMSTDGGKTWSHPTKINKTPRVRTNRLREAAFVPAIAVNSDGVLAVTYYDFRNDDGTGELADQFVLFCDPATSNCARSRNWGNEERLTDISFDILDAPETGAGFFLGDYEGLAAAFDFHPAYGKTDGVGQSSIYTRKLLLSPAVASAAE